MQDVIGEGALRSSYTAESGSLEKYWLIPNNTVCVSSGIAVIQRHERTGIVVEQMGERVFGPGCSVVRDRSARAG